MHISSFITAALLVLASQADAETFRVDVGKDGLTFTPDTITAIGGDIIEFHFHPDNHSVVMGTFNAPCQPAPTDGFFSGFMPVSSGEADHVFQYTVNSSDPTFFYCSVGTHCQKGMSGAINPSSSITLGSYQNGSQSVPLAVSPANPFGGRIVDASDALKPGGAGIVHASMGSVSVLALGVTAFLFL
ncbi:extracellular serine-rich protein [Xylogone sp. PMI_703]|nr:extracellular serine-rich protein [Xylogone sp. PMI_703]